MKRKIIIGIIITVFSLLTTYMVFYISKKLKIKNHASASIVKQPDIFYINLDNTQVSIDYSKQKYSVLFLFDPSCESCQLEAQEFANLDTLRNTYLYCISSSSIPEIKTFASQYKLLDKEYVSFFKLDSESMLKTFGSLYIPHIFIYTNDGNLLKEFKGETKVEVILKYLP